jgi:predicted nucleotidyltransferase
MNFDLKERTVFLTLSGSRAYGTSKSDSDYDYRGIAIPPMDSYIGVMNKFEHAVDDKTKHVWKNYKGIVEDESDMQVYELTKFIRLAAQCNPSIIEVLFTDPSTHVICHPIMNNILEKKDLFLSKQAKARFCGYAISQLQRIKRHKRWLDCPVTHKPERSEFGLPEHKPIPLDQIGAAQAMIQSRVNEFMVDMTDLPEHLRIEIKNGMTKMVKGIWLAINPEISYPVDALEAQAKWESHDDAMKDLIARYEGYSENFLAVLASEKRYQKAKRDWDQYQTWVKNRNPDRAKLEAKFGFDCYSDDTEFLTEFGWKKFDKINIGTKLATVYLGSAKNRKYLGVEYQEPIDRFDGSINNGNMYNFISNHLNVLVTPNHRMLIRKVGRVSDKKSEWMLEEAARLPDTFNILRAPEPRKTNYSNKDLDLPIPLHVYLKIMGWYLSDGSMLFYGERPKDIRISQKKGGRLHWHMSHFNNKWKDKVSSSLYEYTNKANGFRKEDIQEMVLSIRNREITSRIFKDCGSVKNKRVPRWVFNLSKRLIDILLLAMHRGDGTERPDNSKIYYSSLKGLSDDFQELCLMAGYETSLYGPYSYKENETMYQVHWNTTRDREKRLIRCKNLKKIPVDPCNPTRVVCFTVPNGTLITRRNGYIAIHGNSKHASQLVRLIRIAREILQEGKVNVFRPDAEELCYIRNGGWTYEQIIEFAEKEDENLVEVAKLSKLPRNPDINAIHKLTYETVYEYNRKHTKRTTSF